MPDLRALVADVVCRYNVSASDGHSAQGLLIDDLVTVLRDPDWGVGYGQGLTDGIKALLATASSDPVRRLAIFDAMGLDVREGWISTWELHGGQTKEFNVRCWGDEGTRPDCLVVVPRGEATDA